MRPAGWTALAYCLLFQSSLRQRVAKHYQSDSLQIRSISSINRPCTHKPSGSLPKRHTRGQIEVTGMVRISRDSSDRNIQILRVYANMPTEARGIVGNGLQEQLFFLLALVTRCPVEMPSLSTDYLQQTYFLGRSVHQQIINSIHRQFFPPGIRLSNVHPLHASIHPSVRTLNQSPTKQLIHLSIHQP